MVQNLIIKKSFKRNAIHLHPFGWSLLGEKKIKKRSYMARQSFYETLKTVFNAIGFQFLVLDGERFGNTITCHGS